MTTIPNFAEIPLRSEVDDTSTLAAWQAAVRADPQSEHGQLARESIATLQR